MVVRHLVEEQCLTVYEVVHRVEQQLFVDLVCVGAEREA